MDISSAANSKRVLAIYEILKKVYPEARPLLNYRNPFELLVSTILAAQCTDERVNSVTPKLFARCSSPAEMLCLSQTELEEMIRPTGFFRNKARQLKKLCFVLTERYDEKIPETIEELIKLPGVGRKTANVIVGHCFNKPAIVVDTHFMRLAHRLGLSRQKDPQKIESEVRSLIPEALQTNFSDVLNWHGRFRCKARRPECSICEIRDFCPYQPKELN